MLDNPLLQQLHDIHLPHAIGYWPIAPGWWVLFLCLVITFSLSAFYLSRFLKGYQLKKAYLLELDEIKKQFQQDQNARMALEKLTQLLKSFALACYPRQMVASLHGQAWYDFLQKTAPNLDLKPIYDLLTEALYQKQLTKDISPAFVVVSAWIKKQRLSCMT